ncbi:hypothetical protein EJ03DRAFT_324137 [Teratosphaeria nubilosa]|uniref:Uncharacterized protein n=1 Tax=Teratosphaeria nubilosa TaxID=161662 RepID=A0A6G1LKJ3_9PEZI|nr:hypothetical protein EJ03DRAFT_324137 [Teratosphaeria nubilosa]
MSSPPTPPKPTPQTCHCSLVPLTFPHAPLTQTTILPTPATAAGYLNHPDQKPPTSKSSAHRTNSRNNYMGEKDRQSAFILQDLRIFNADSVDFRECEGCRGFNNEGMCGEHTDDTRD